MQPLVIITLGVLLLLLGIFVLKQDYKSKSNQVFFCLMFFSIIWIISNYLSNHLKTQSEVLMFNRLIFFSTIYLIWFANLLSMIYPSRNKYVRPIVLLLGWGSATLVALLSFSNYIVMDIEILEGYSNIKFGELSILYIIIFGINFVSFLVNVIRLLIKSEGLERVKSQYLFTGLVLSSIGAIITNLILPVVYNTFEASNWGSLFVIIFIVFVGYSILRHRLFGIKILLSQIFFVLIRTLILFSLIIFVILYYQGLDFQNILWNKILLILVILGIFSIIEKTLIPKFENKLSTDILKITPNNDSKVQTFYDDLSTEFDISKIVKSSEEFLISLLEISFCKIIVIDYNQDRVLFSDSSLNDQEIFYLNRNVEHKNFFVQDELDYDSSERYLAVNNLLKKYSIELAIPLKKESKIRGLIIIGKKNNSSGYKNEELILLNNIVNPITVSLSRSILYSQVKQFNELLKQKVDEQTRELQEKVLELEAARNKERDMIDIMGHELRTPASVVKMNIELLSQWKNKIEKGGNTISSWEDFDKYTHRISESIGNEISIINTLLTSAKLEGNNLVLNKTSVDVNNAIELSIEGHKVDADSKGLYIRYQHEDSTPKVLADKGRFQEIVDNLIGNAIKYTEKGMVEIKTSFDSNNVYISIIDTGRGMTQEEVNNLGKKFYRTDQYIKDGENKTNGLVRPGGTGLGLYVVFGLIHAHGGEYRVYSKLGEGSMFSFSMPISKDQETEKEGLYSGNMFDKLDLNKDSIQSTGRSLKDILGQ